MPGLIAAGTVVGRYRIEGLLGRGGMATVYVATEQELGRQVALKMLETGPGTDPAFIGRFQREGRMQASFEHPHVVGVLEAGESDAGAFLAMQCVAGPTLAELIAAGALTAGRALALLDQIAEALDAAHAAGLVHRDVKPRNVLVADDDHAYLADFGLTTIGGDVGPTMTGELLGTLAYLAPEVIRGDPATCASDRYAFAALAFECLTGSVVFPRQTQAAQLYAHTSDPPPRISTRRAELPAALDDVFERGLAKRPEDRPRTAARLVGEIRAALGSAAIATLAPPAPRRGQDGEDRTTAPTPVPALPPATAPARPRAGLVALALLVGAALALGAAYVFDIDGDDRAAVAAPPPVLPGATVLGSDLSAPGRTLGCDRRAVRPASPDCSVTQSELPGARVVVPQNGVIRRWAVRAAVGEVQLQVIRPRDNSFFQIAVSRNEFADGQIHAYRTELAVEAGDILGVHVISGSGIGLRRGVSGATTTRWLPRLTGVARDPERGPRSGFDGELLLRAELIPGAAHRLPQQLTGATAAALPTGKIARREQIGLPGGRRVEIRVVDTGKFFALDLIRGDRRVARQLLADFVAGAGEVTTFEVYTEKGKPEEAAVYLEYRRTGSERLLSHYLLVPRRAFEYIN